MAHLKPCVSVLSTSYFGLLNGHPERENKRSVPQGKDVMKVKERLELVRQTTGCPTNSALAEWVGVNSPQVVSGWESRDSISGDGAVKVSRATGADLHWLMTSDGEPFPNGAKHFPGALPNDAINRVRMNEDAIDAIKMVLAAALRTMAAEIPALGRQLASALGDLQGSSGSQKQVLEGVVLAVATGLKSSAPEAPHAARGVSVGKRSRMDR